jgi:hypothetical protein
MKKIINYLILGGAVTLAACGDDDNGLNPQPPAPTFKIVHMDFGRSPTTQPTAEMIQNALIDNDSVYVNPINEPGATGSWAEMSSTGHIAGAALKAEELAAVSPRVTANPKNNTIYVPAEFYQAATHPSMAGLGALKLKVASR